MVIKEEENKAQKVPHGLKLCLRNGNLIDFAEIRCLDCLFRAMSDWISLELLSFFPSLSHWTLKT